MPPSFEIKTGAFTGSKLHQPTPERPKPEKSRLSEVSTFQTKQDLALQQIEAALAADVRRGVVLADAGYGADMKFQAGLLALGLDYVVGVQAHATVWPDGTVPQNSDAPPKPWSGRGRRPHNLRRTPDHGPVQGRPWAQALAPTAWQKVTWREGSNAALTFRFAATRVRPARYVILGDEQRREPWPELWLLVEWPEGEGEPTKFWFANLEADVALDELVRLAKVRWRIERDDLDLKQELGLGHDEGRGWRGFHHHASLWIAAYGFLVRERLAFSPSGTDGTPSLRRRVPPLP
ncbi:MAG: IS701 family transposase [Geminicoccaceae bacterium]|nr:MAG: IS701 family transposase [Geminicoccaceae bacterium]